jgi:hypothetical protein
MARLSTAVVAPQKKKTEPSEKVFFPPSLCCARQSEGKRLRGEALSRKQSSIHNAITGTKAPKGGRGEERSRPNDSDDK